MHQLLRYVPITLLVCGTFCLEAASAGQGGECRRTALDQLRTSSPNGFAIYRQISRPDFFTGWIDCHDAQFDLSTAVHESTHFITNETDAFPMVGGGAVRRPHEVSAFFPPSRIANQFTPDDFVSIYLRGGKASSSTDLLYLLDELNAYTHDLATAVDLKDRRVANESVDHRDGLAALMAFVAVYAERAKESEPETWSGLQAPRVARTIAALWGHAERVMASSCGIPNFGTADKSYIRHVCAAGAQSALEPILGRAPVCPTACLEATLDLDQIADEDQSAASPSPDEERSIDGQLAAPPHHPFNIPVGPRRHKISADDD